MLNREAVVSTVAGTSSFCKADIWALPAEKLYEAPRRMEVAFYASEGYRAANEMKNSGFNITSVADRAKVIWPGVFARKFVKDPAFGLPFLTSSSMMEARPKASVYLSTKNTKNIEDYVVHSGTVLISRSGTVGSVCLVTDSIAGWAVTDDAIRVDVNDPDDLGPVYCYLQSSLGQYLIKRAQTGSVVRHIYEEDVSILPLPDLPRRLRKELSDRIKKISANRVEANRLLENAEKEVSTQNDLNIEANTDVSGFDVFSSSLSTVLEQRSEEGYQRLDSKFYRPEALELRQQIKKCQQWQYLDEIAQVTLLGKTFVPGVNKVEERNGTPYFTGKELFSVRIVPDTFITSKKRRDIDKLIVKSGTTLVTCGGTIGKVSYANSEVSGTAVSHHVMRVASRGEIHPGYLYAILASSIGKIQFDRSSYGSVIPMLHDSLLKRFVIPIPSDSGRSIGELIDSAFNHFSTATEMEDEAIRLFLTAIHRGRATTEAEWGEEY